MYSQKLLHKFKILGKELRQTTIMNIFVQDEPYKKLL